MAEIDVGLIGAQIAHHIGVTLQRNNGQDAIVFKKAYAVGSAASDVEHSLP